MAWEGYVSGGSVKVGSESQGSLQDTACQARSRMCSSGRPSTRQVSAGVFPLQPGLCALLGVFSKAVSDLSSFADGRLAFLDAVQAIRVV